MNEWMQRIVDKMHACIRDLESYEWSESLKQQDFFRGQMTVCVSFLQVVVNDAPYNDTPILHRHIKRMIRNKICERRYWQTKDVLKRFSSQLEERRLRLTHIEPENWKRVPQRLREDVLNYFDTSFREESDALKEARREKWFEQLILAGWMADELKGLSDERGASS